jgi:hypothetical protein
MNLTVIMMIKIKSDLQLKALFVTKIVSQAMNFDSCLRPSGFNSSFLCLNECNDFIFLMKYDCSSVLYC